MPTLYENIDKISDEKLKTAIKAQFAGLEQMINLELDKLQSENLELRVLNDKLTFELVRVKSKSG